MMMMMISCFNQEKIRFLLQRSQWRIQGRGPALPPLFWVKKEEITERKKASRTRKSRPPPPDPPLVLA